MRQTKGKATRRLEHNAPWLAHHPRVRFGFRRASKSLKRSANDVVLS